MVRTSNLNIAKWYVPMQEKNKKPFERSGSTRKQIRFEDALFDNIETDRAKTGEAFSEWVKDACKKKLNR